MTCGGLVGERCDVGDVALGDGLCGSAFDCVADENLGDVFWCVVGQAYTHHARGLVRGDHVGTVREVGVLDDGVCEDVSDASW